MTFNTDLEALVYISIIGLSLYLVNKFISLIFRKGHIPIYNIQDIKPSLDRLTIDGTLGMGELLSIGYILDTCSKVKKYAKNIEDTDSYNLIINKITYLQSLSDLNTDIQRCIISENEMSDDASSNLKSIRREINNINNKIKQKLNSYINSSSVRTMLQDSVITLRNDRYCLPVKQEYRQQFSGMIHDQSSTGSTLFIEPMAIVEFNNKLKELYSKEQEEIEIILQRLSIKASEYIEELQINLNTLVELDFIFAKGALSKKLNSVEPKFNTNGYINIKKGRHPLLDSKTVVPIDIYLGDSFSMLMITGPNTGGKTVSLKTVGLLTMMGQSGLHIPAYDGSELAIFDEIYADIGDEQSIEQNLSTFSSHMTNIINILNKATDKSLVLFDELGAGTDPTEGAALAMSILQNLHNQKIRTIATTHYSELKVFALSTNGIENACCEFDVKTLKPTYKLLIGIPGKSNAFEISKKLGLPDYIIGEAKKLITEQDKQFEDLITELETSQKIIDNNKEKTKAYLLEIETLKKSMEQKKDKIASQHESTINDAKKEAHKIIQEAKNYADETIRKFNKWSKEHGNINTSQMEKERQNARKKLSDLEKNLMPTAKNKGVTNTNLRISKGDYVYVSTFDQKGTVLEDPNSKGDVLVQLGIIKTKVNKSFITLIDEPEIINKHITKNRSGKVTLNKSQHIRPEIDVRGYTSEEALSTIDKYMDDAYLSNLPQVTIIHGKGTGVLRNSIHKKLRTVKYVKSFRLGNFGEGESGVTIVEFK